MYATVDDIEARCRKTLTEEERKLCETLLGDVAVLIDAYGKTASDDAKRVVSCNAVLRTVGSGEESVPFGATQGTVSALGYSQTWSLGSSGSVGELYLSKTDKKLLGCGNRITFINSLEVEE